MSRKAFLVQVELDVQAVTCPGVWLCSNGQVSLQVYMLDSCVQTANYKPNFPIHCNEKFVFYKTFFPKHQLSQLEKDLSNHWFYVELVQWQSCEIGNVLATFQTTLDELLYPSTTSGSIAGVDLDLLMEPSRTFPGMIAPKIEVSTRTTIEETLCSCKKPASSTVIVNPKVICSSPLKMQENVCRKVCHSVEYSRRKQPKALKTKPLFCYRRAEDDLILRKPKYIPENTICRRSKSLERKNYNVRKQKNELLRKRKEYSPVRLCGCGSGHRENFCPICSKYSGYFSVSSLKPTTDIQTNKPLRTNLFDEEKKCEPRNDLCPCCRPKAAPVEKTESDTDSGKQVCCCIVKEDQRPASLAQKLHAKLTKTLCAIPKPIEWSCVDNEYEYEDCNCKCATSKGELYKDLQKFYGDLYEKVRSNLCPSDY